MEKESPAAAPQTEEERLLLRRAADKADRCRRQNLMTSTRFLSPRELAMAAQAFRAGGNTTCRLAGGFRTAERAVLIFLPDWMEEAPSGNESPVAVVKASYAADYAEISHRDVLGALMALGIERDTVGDILPGNGCVYFAVLREILPFVLQNLESAGKACFHCAEIQPDEAQPRAAAFALIRDTVSSLRLDSVVSSGFGMSREKATDLIRAGKVRTDHQDCLKPDKLLAAGAVITARGFGKLELAEVGGLTRKGRISIQIKRYL
jgi:RNA-binding protein YlmH